MGGPGSGTKWDKKGAVEDYRRLDVRVLHREHGIKPGSQITVQYEWRGEQVAQEVYFDWTPCNYGGLRPWLICMACGGRVALLYLRGKYFSCRRCHNLTYRSSQESDGRVSKFLRNYDGFGEPEDLTLFAFNRLWGRIRKERDRLQKELSRRRRGRPPKKASEE
jgi:hypothetical protein